MDQFIFLGSNQLSAIRWTLRLIDIGTYINDAVDLSIILQGLAAHGDLNNIGKLTGKIIKIIVQLLMEGALEYMKMLDNQK